MLPAVVTPNRRRFGVRRGRGRGFTLGHEIGGGLLAFWARSLRGGLLLGAFTLASTEGIAASRGGFGFVRRSFETLHMLQEVVEAREGQAGEIGGEVRIHGVDALEEFGDHKLLVSIRDTAGRGVYELELAVREKHDESLVLEKKIGSEFDQRRAGGRE